MTQTTSHIHYLREALALAEMRRGFCAPNPAVGVVVVKAGTILATGYHVCAGEPHAEAEALSRISKQAAKDATLYVTLEPCNFYGKTPPCVPYLVAYGIKTVCYGMVDPNPLVSGRGIAALQSAGITCLPIHLPEIVDFYASYTHWTRHKVPYITAKLAMSLDGKIAGRGGKRAAITSEVANQFTHLFRQKSDGILTTVKTIIQDDPQLNVRLPHSCLKKPVYVLDTHLMLPIRARLFKTAANITLFHKSDADKARKRILEAKDVRCVPITWENARLSISEIVNYLGKLGMHDILLEAGGTCFEAFAEAGYMKRAFVYVALKWLGKQAQSAFLSGTQIFSCARHLKWHPLGRDAACEFYF